MGIRFLVKDSEILTWMMPLPSAFSAPNLAPFQSGVIAGRVATPAMDEAMRYESGGAVAARRALALPPSSNELCLLVRIPDFTGFNFSFTDTKVWK